MAANMIGIKKNVIIVSLGFMPLVMFNPVILSKDGPYETEEGCLSLSGTRKATNAKISGIKFPPVQMEVKEIALMKSENKGGKMIYTRI